MTRNLPALHCLNAMHPSSLVNAPLMLRTLLQYVSFYTFTAAILALQNSYQYICVGNEHSANSGNVVHPR